MGLYAKFMSVFCGGAAGFALINGYEKCVGRRGDKRGDGIENESGRKLYEREKRKMGEGNDAGENLRTG